MCTYYIGPTYCDLFLKEHKKSMIMWVKFILDDNWKTATVIGYVVYGNSYVI